jgi:hypothetical protein
MQSLVIKSSVLDVCSDLSNNFERFKVINFTRNVVKPSLYVRFFLSPWQRNGPIP